MKIDELFENLRSDESIWFEHSGVQRQALKQIYYSNSFLNAVSEVFEHRGIEQARLYVLGKCQTGESGAARGMLKVLDHIARCPAANDDAPVGRTVIKALLSFKPTRTS